MFKFLMSFIDKNLSAPLTEDPKNPLFWPIETRDFSYLEGKPVRWTNLNYRNGAVQECVIRAIDYAVGYTITCKDDPLDYFSCNNGPLSPNFSKMSEEEETMYNIDFRCVLGMLEKGYYSCAEADHAAREHGGMEANATAAACPFNA